MGGASWKQNSGKMPQMIVKTLQVHGGLVRVYLAPLPGFSCFPLIHTVACAFYGNNNKSDADSGLKTFISSKPRFAIV